MIIYALVSVAALGLVLSQVVRAYVSHSKSVIISDLGEEVPEFAQSADLRSKSEGLYPFAKSYLASHSIVNGHIIFIEIFGHPVLGSTNSSLVAKLHSVATFISNPPSATKFVNVNSKSSSYLVMGSPIKVSGNVVGSLVGVTSLSVLNSQESQVIDLAGIEALVALIFSVGAGYFLMRRVMKTVGRITETAVEISRGDLERRIEYIGPPDEVGRLARVFDEMLSRISQTMESQKRLLADVSHQLKTPLTVIRGNLELMSRAKTMSTEDMNETLAVVIAETDYMKTMLEGLLLLERINETEPLTESIVDLRTFISEVFTSAIVMARREWQLSEIQDVKIRIDSTKLRGALLNLLDNAAKATSVEDVIEVSAGVEDGWLQISVRDTGSGIAEEHLSSIFERFERGTSRDQRGAGLGLAIVKAVVNAHGGNVNVQSTPGFGSLFNIRLPIGRIVHDNEME